MTPATRENGEGEFSGGDEGLPATSDPTKRRKLETRREEEATREVGNHAEASQQQVSQPRPLM
jgi:hypothetical protein